MKTLLLALSLSASTAPAVSSAPTILILGKTRARMSEVITLLSHLGPIVPAFSESEALEKLAAYPTIKVVLLGGAVEPETRRRIQSWLRTHNPKATTSEPGVQYDYTDGNIRYDVRRKLSQH
jgi:hypothetical protein